MCNLGILSLIWSPHNVVNILGECVSDGMKKLQKTRQMMKRQWAMHSSDVYITAKQSILFAIKLNY